MSLDPDSGDGCVPGSVKLPQVHMHEDYVIVIGSQRDPKSRREDREFLGRLFRQKKGWRQRYASSISHSLEPVFVTVLLQQPSGIETGYH
jgi:hypothetical protein